MGASWLGEGCHALLLAHHLGSTHYSGRPAFCERGHIFCSSLPTTATRGWPCCWRVLPRVRCVTALLATRRRHWMMSRQVKACMCSWSLVQRRPLLTPVWLLPCWCPVGAGEAGYLEQLPSSHLPCYSSPPQAAALLDSAADFQVGPLHHPAVLLLPGPRMPLDRVAHGCTSSLACCP